MKRILTIITAFAIPIVMMGQIKKIEYTPKVKGKVEITNLLGEVSLQNTGGNAIVIESDFNLEKPERADGLKLLGAAEDNTDLGINVSEENGVIVIQGATRQVRDYKYKISIPEGMAVNLDYNSPFAKNDISVDSFNGSLEIKTLNANIKIGKSSGPFTINTISGNIEVVFDKLNQNEPTSLATINGYIDITMPASDKANFEINTINGNVYNNLDVKASAKESDKAKERLAYGMDVMRMKGANSYTLNGGGQKVFLKTISGNIYLRKK